MGVIDEVKQRLDIVEVIGEYVPLTKAGRTFRALCPFHSEKHPSFYVYPERQSWHCFGACATGGDVFSFIMKKEGLDFGEVLHRLADRAGVTVPSRLEPEAGRDAKDRLYQVNEVAAQYYHRLLFDSPAAEKARQYLARRGLSSKSVDQFQLGFSLNSWDSLKQHLVERGYAEPELIGAGLLSSSDAGGSYDRFRDKLMFPIYDKGGRVTGFGARVLDDSLPKYINSPQTPIFDKSGCLYGINLASAAIRQQDRVVIVEGYMDVISAYQNGFSNVVASMGTSITEKQMTTLKKLTRNIALALDADTAGEEAMLRGVGYENILGAEVKIVLLPEGKDPDDVIREDAGNWQSLLGQALPIIDYAFDRLTARLDLRTAGDAQLAFEKLLPIVDEINDPVRRGRYFQKLASLVGVTERSLEGALKKSRLSQSRRGAKAARQKPSLSETMRPLLSSPIEEYCLALLLRYPELRQNAQGLLPEYFGNTENREVFIAWQQAGDLVSLKERLPVAVHEYLDSLMNMSLPPTPVESRYGDCVLNLRRIYLQRLEAERAEALALAAGSGGGSAELVRLEELGIEVSRQLKEVFAQKGAHGLGKGR